jgi:hypothetical protein
VFRFRPARSVQFSPGVDTSNPWNGIDEVVEMLVGIAVLLFVLMEVRGSRTAGSSGARQ